MSLLDPNPDTGLHPGLRNTIFLLACHYAGDSLISLEPVFFRRAYNCLHRALERSDRLVDFIEAQALLSVYYILKGRCCGLIAVLRPIFF